MPTMHAILCTEVSEITDGCVECLHTALHSYHVISDIVRINTVVLLSLNEVLLWLVVCSILCGYELQSDVFQSFRLCFNFKTPDYFSSFCFVEVAILFSYLYSFTLKYISVWAGKFFEVGNQEHSFKL